MTDQKAPRGDSEKSPYSLNTSDKKGLLGLLETLLRKFKTVMQLMMIVPLYGVASIILGVSIAPGVMLVRGAYHLSNGYSDIVSAFIIGAAVVASFFACGFTAMVVLPLINILFVGRLKQWKGPYYSLEAIRWYVHNGILYLLRYSFLEFVTPSPFSLWFYKAMGMKVGKNSVINSTNISDPSLIVLGHRVTIGGSATIVAHYGQAGYLVLSPVLIEDDVTVGLRATVMGGAKIRKGAKILPNSVVMPKTEVPAGEIWGGVPAHKLDLKKMISPENPE